MITTMMNQLPKYSQPPVAAMQSLEQRSEPAFHALFVSDVLHLICDLLELSDWISLMLTCRSTFATAASHIWANLDGVHVLTDLLIQATEKKNSNKAGDLAVDFSRFDIYAPWVRHLRVYGRTSKYLQGEFRRRCALRSQKSSLFPKLESITMRTSDLHHDSDALMWIEILAAPTLAELRVIPIEKIGATARVSFAATTNISKVLSQSCPKVRRLEFCPSSAVDTSDDDGLSDTLWKTCLGKSFKSFVGLCEIRSSVLLIDRGGLAILGALPCLEKLRLNGCDEYPHGLELTIPDNSFPALTYLSLLEIDVDSLLALMSVSNFVQHPTSISLSQRFYLKKPYNDEGLGCQDWLTRNLPLFLYHTSSLKSFSYDARELLSNNQQPGYHIESSSLLQAISMPNLEHLYLTGLFFPLDFSIGIAAACPSLVELRMPDFFVRSEDLHWFARLPKLKHLTLRTSFSTLPSEWHSLNGPLETFTHVQHYIHRSYPTSPDQVTKFLLSLWPNLRIGVKPPEWG